MEEKQFAGREVKAAVLERYRKADEGVNAGFFVFKKQKSGCGGNFLGLVSK